MAKRFTFRLETLLRVRKLREREAQRGVAAVQAEIVAIDGLTRQIHAEIAAQQAYVRGSFHAAPSAGVAPVSRDERLDTTNVIRGRAWIAHLQRMLEHQARERTKAETRLRDALQALIQARTQSQIVEKLRERRLNEYRERRERQDESAADELARQLQAFRGEAAAL